MKVLEIPNLKIGKPFALGLWQGQHITTEARGKPLPARKEVTGVPQSPLRASIQ